MGVSGSFAGLLGRSLDVLLGRGVMGEEDVERLEEALLSVDCGPAVAEALAEEMREWVRRAGPGVRKEVVYEALAEKIAARLASPVVGRKAEETARPRETPRVVLFVGANGTGKTTTLAKLAAREIRAGRRALLGACDTFRAAAREQLEGWARRIGADFVGGAPDGGRRVRRGDPAAVAYDAVCAARARGVDWVGLDTAGRLVNKENLMRELEKIHRVLTKKFRPPDETLLVLDAASGRNGVAQVEGFAGRLPLTGLVVAKLDGAARAGFLLEAVEKFAVPAQWVGTGEGVDDLEPFDARDFARALAGTA